MEKFITLIQLTRLNKPIGFMLLFWPCAWGLTLAYYYNLDTNLYIKNLILFFFGAVLMRSAGCIFNDIVDRDFDKKVKRTKNRPIASGKIKILNAFIFAAILCLIALLILLQFNFLTIMLGISSMLFAFSYPFMKRITYWPQLFLGLTFNWGIIMGWTSIMNQISTPIIILYIAAIFWTLAYDTIYGTQDIKDDEIIGIKSTSIKFKGNLNLFIAVCYGLFISLILYLCFVMNIDKTIIVLSIFFILTLIYQMKIFKVNKPESCLKAFKINNLTGMFVYIYILSFSIL